MKRFFLLISLAQILIAANCQKDSLSVDQLINLTLEDLLNIKVNVSTTNPIDILNSPSTVSFIDRAMIENFNFQSIDEALTYLAGMDVYQTVMDRNVPTSRGVLQNFYANKVLLMINNIPTFQPIYGEGTIDRININDVERIEVLLGPASVLYGSNAYSAVINIILKSAEKAKIESYIEMGIPTLFSSGLNFSYKKEKLEIVGSLNTFHDERLAFDFPNANWDKYNGDSLFSMTEYLDNNNFNFDLKYKNFRLYYNLFKFDHTFYGASPSYASAGGQEMNNSGQLVNLQYDKSNDKSRLIANIGNDYYARTHPISFDRTNMIHINGNRFYSDLKYNYRFIESLNFEIGGRSELWTGQHETWNGMTNSFVKSNLLLNKPQLYFSAFSQLDYSSKYFSIVGGLRYTKNQFLGNTVQSGWDNFSSRITTLFKLNKNNSFKLIYGESFRAPTIFELYFTHPTVNGNPELRPESNRPFEINYLTRYNKFFLQLSTYYSHYFDLIQRVTLETSPPSVYSNKSNFEAHGAELSLKYLDQKRINLFLNYNFIFRSNLAYNNNLQYVPKHNISFGVNKCINEFAFAVNGRYYSSVDGNLGKIKPQLFMEAHVNYKQNIYNLHLKHQLSLKNITGSKMLIPEYIRNTNNINELPGVTYGRRLTYSLSIVF